MNLSKDQARRLAVLLGWARVGLGAVALVAPKLPLRPWVGEDRHSPGAQVLGRALGARDLALGLGPVLAARSGGPVRGWTEAGGLADAGDVAVTLLAFGKLPRVGRLIVIASASGGVVAARLLAPHLD